MGRSNKIQQDNQARLRIEKPVISKIIDQKTPNTAEVCKTRSRENLLLYCDTNDNVASGQ